MNSSEAKWYKDFESAMHGYRKNLELVVPKSKDIEIIAKSIEEERNSARRDIYLRGTRREDKAYFHSEAPNPDTNPSERHTLYLESIKIREAIGTPFLTPATLNEGDRVVIWIKDHFYENQTAIVQSYRKVTNEYLVEIVSKKPHKYGYKTHYNAKALMYVRLQDVKLCRRKD